MMDTIAGPSLLTASRNALSLLEIQRHTVLVCNCELDAHYQPIPHTLDARAALQVALLDETIGDLGAAIHVAERAGWRPTPSALGRWLGYLRLIWLHPRRDVRPAPLSPITLRDITGRPL